mgnify:CR=1 FL=1
MQSPQALLSFMMQVSHEIMRTGWSAEEDDCDAGVCSMPTTFIKGCDRVALQGDGAVEIDGQFLGMTIRGQCRSDGVCLSLIHI